MTLVGRMRDHCVIVSLAAMTAIAAGDRAEAQCLSGSGYGFYLVKDTYNSYIEVAHPDCTKDTSLEIYSFSLQLVDFTAGRTATIMPGMGDPGVHTSNPLTTSAPQNMDGFVGWEGPYTFSTNSLLDIGTYDYLFEGVSSDGTYTYPMTSDLLGFYVDNNPPEGNVSAGGPYNVGDTVALSVGASDLDGGSITYEWSILSKPSGSPSSLSSGSAASPTITLGSKHDIGNWEVRVRFADDEAEQVTDTDSFVVENRPPNVTISGPTEIDALNDIQLTAAPTTDQDGEDVTFVWDILTAPPTTTFAPQSSFSTSTTLTIPTGPDEIGTFEFQVTGTDESNEDDIDTHTITVNPVPPEIDLVGETEIDVGEAIDLETLIVDDAYGDPLASFDWEILQVPISAGVPLGTTDTSPTLFIPTGAADAGTWRFRLTVTDQVGETADEEVTVLVDGLPDADIVGPDQTASLTLDLTLDGSSSIDPDTPGGPPDYDHLSDGAVTVSPGIVRWSWSVLGVPPEHYGDYFEGPVADVFGVNGSGQTLYFAAGELPSGDWIFELEIEDGEGNTDYDTHAVTVIEEGLPPFAILSPPSYHLTTVDGFTTGPIGVSGGFSFDLDNLLDSSQAPGLGITDYSWSYAYTPSGCVAVPPLPSGSSATVALMFGAGALVDGSCQGVYQPVLTVTDDDMPTARASSNSTVVMIGNCVGALCIDHPTTAAPEFVKFSDQTNILIYYHLNSVLYDNPAYAAGLRLQLRIDKALTSGPPVYSRAWDLDLLPSEKGGPLVVHWSGFTDGGQRPDPGLYDVTLQLVDGTGTPTGDSATELSAIQIQLLDVAVAAGSDTLLNLNGAEEATDSLSITYDVTGAPPGDLGYDQITMRVYDLGTSGIVYEESHVAPFDGTIDWDGEIGSGVFLTPGAYEVELEIFDMGASLGVSTRHEFDAYRIDAELAGVADADEVDPGAALGIGDTISLTVSLEGDLSRLAGDVTVDVTTEEGTLSATDGTTTIAIDSAPTFPVSSFSVPLTLTLEGVAQGAAGKTTVEASYAPPSGVTSAKEASDEVAIAVVDLSLRVAVSDPARQDTDGVFLRGARMPTLVSAANLAELTPQMQPVTVKAGPDFTGGTVELSLIGGTAANIELYEPGGSAIPVTLPKIWTDSDFVVGELEQELLAYGKSFGEARLRLEYNDGATVLADEELLFRVAHQPPAVGTALPPGQFPFFMPVEVANAGMPVSIAIDPARHSEWHGRNVAIYLVDHKDAATWALNPALTDVTGAPETVMVDATSVAANMHVIWPSAVPGAYDLVIEMDSTPEDTATFTSDGQLTPGDLLIQGPAGAPSLSVYAPFGAVGALPTATVDYGMGAAPSTVAIPNGYDLLDVAPAANFDFRMRGRVVHPNPMPPSAPIVMIAHGNHIPRTVTLVGGGGTITVDADLTSDENFRGHTWLQEWLASRGYITISVDLDEMHGNHSSFVMPKIDSTGIKLRAWVLLKNLELAVTDATFAGGVLNGHIDLSNLYLIGHSRGGEAVLQALDLLNTPADRPAGATLNAAVDAATIRAVVSLAPVSQSEEAGDLDAYDTPFLLLYGTADGDVNGASGGVRPFRHYDNATGKRFGVVIEGANHNYWNSSWGYSDARETLVFASAPGTLTSMDIVDTTTLMPPVPHVGAGLISRPQQVSAALGYIGAFLQHEALGDPNARAFLSQDAARVRPLDVDPALEIHTLSRHDAAALVTRIDDYESNGATNLSSASTTVSLAMLGGATEGVLYDTILGSVNQPEDRFFQSTQGVVFDWTGPASYALDLPAASRDLRGTTAVSLRVAQQPDHPRTVLLDADLSFEMELEDGSANTVRISSQRWGPVPDIYPSVVGGTSTTSGIFKTFRFPLHAFETDGATIDLGDIHRIRLVFAEAGHSGEGRIALDEVEIE